MELLLIRHAQPLRIEREDGLAADPPLTELGHSQALAMAAWLAEEPLHAVYVSPLLRARQTAAPLADALGLEPVVAEGLAEYDRHDPHYVPLEDLKARRTEADALRWAELLAGNDSEERRLWRDEVVGAVEAIIGANRGRVVAAVCHGGVINAYVSHVLKVSSPIVFEPYYTAVNRVMAAGSGERSLLTVNESPWMRRLPKPVATAR